MTTLTITGTANQLSDAGIQAFLDTSDVRAASVRGGDTLVLDPNASTTLTIDNASLMVMGTLRSRPASPSIQHLIRFTNVVESLFAGGAFYQITAVAGSGTTRTLTLGLRPGQTAHNMTTSDTVTLSNFPLQAGLNSKYNGSFPITAATNTTITVSFPLGDPGLPGTLNTVCRNSNDSSHAFCTNALVNTPTMNDKGLWVMGGGILDVVASVRAPWTVATGALVAGDTTITCVGAITGWQVGDEILITPTDLSWTHEELRTLTAVNTGTKQVTFSPGLTYNHPTCTPKPGGTTFTAEVANLSTNSWIKGQDATHRPHLMIHNTVLTPQTITGLGFQFMGAREVANAGKTRAFVGRWPLHIHKSNNMNVGSVLTRLVARDCGSHTFVTHGTNGVTLNDCVAYKNILAPFWWDEDYDDDSSDDIMWNHCLANNVDSTNVADSGQSQRLNAFALVGNNVDMAVHVRDCRASGVKGGNDSGGFGWPATDAFITGWSIEGVNVAHNNKNYGVVSWRNNIQLGHHDSPDFVCYRNGGGSSMNGAYGNPIRYHRLIASENGWDAATTCEFPGLHNQIVTSKTDIEGHWGIVRDSFLDASGYQPCVHVDFSFSPLTSIRVQYEDNDFRNPKDGIFVQIDNRPPGGGGDAPEPKAYDWIRTRCRAVGDTVDRDLTFADFHVITGRAGTEFRLQSRDDQTASRMYFPGDYPATPYIVESIAPFAPSVSTQSLPQASAGFAYSTTLAAVLMEGTLTWRVKVGSAALPPGLALAPTTGVISGTPTTQGTFPVSIEAEDDRGLFASKDFAIVVGASPILQITTTNLDPYSLVGQSYSRTLARTGGVGPFTWTMAPGTPNPLPSGLSLSSAGVISGTPTAAGNTTVRIRVTDSTNAFDEQTFHVLIAGPLVVASSSLPNGVPSVVYPNASITATQGLPPYTFARTAGTLPPGLTLSSGGAISGTPTTSGTYAFTVTATDTGANTDSEDFSITIVPALALTVTTQPKGRVGHRWHASVVPTGGVGPFTFDVDGTMPPGVALYQNANKASIYGTPTTAGSYAFTVTATGALIPSQATVPVSVVIAAVPGLERPVAGEPLSDTPKSTEVVDDAFSLLEDLDMVVFAPASGVVPLPAGVKVFSLVDAFDMPADTYQIMLECSWPTTWVPGLKTLTGFTGSLGIPVPDGGGTVRWKVEI